MQIIIGLTVMAKRSRIGKGLSKQIGSVKTKKIM
jgi:hypothetical protein